MPIETVLNRVGPVGTDGLANEMEGLVERLSPSVVLIDSGRGHGAGVIWTGDGLVVTNDHVAHGRGVVVEMVDGTRFEAQVIARDRQNDLALLQTLARGLPAAPVRDSRSVRLGEVVLAMGHPFGMRGNVSLGIVSGSGDLPWMGQMRREMLQADIFLAPGNSGGPIVDVEGRVVAIASMVASPGVALAIPSRVVSRFVRSHSLKLAA